MFNVRRTLDILPRYAFAAFVGVLGLFNSSKLEIRQVTNTNAELLFQNGQIISLVLILVCISGFLGESFAIFRYRKRKGRKIAKKDEEVKRLQQTVSVYDKIKIVATTDRAGPLHTLNPAHAHRDEEE
jgi:hypothetical protein